MADPTRHVRLDDLGVPPGRVPPGRGGARPDPYGPWKVPAIIIASLLVAWIVMVVAKPDDSSKTTATDGSGEQASADGSGDESATGPTTTTEADLPPYDGWVNPASSGRMWSDEVPGILTFRGNPTRSYYGQGPVPSNPEVLWTYPGNGGGLCGNSSDGGVTSTWCGTGWTGQPAVWENPDDGKTWVSFGAYDYGIHFLDFETGDKLLDTFKTGDIIKGTVTVDPDGFPLLYSGSRDNYYRVLSTDTNPPQELYAISAYEVQKKWNDDWDGSGLVIDDYLFEGGENSWFFIYKLNRGYGPDGKVTVNPERVFATPGWDDELLSHITDGQVSIETSVAISGNTVYFANSGGLVQGWDISGLKDGVEPTRVFRFWTGDDTDATIAIDTEGFLYVGSEYERHNARSTEIGQIMKLDPTKPDDPLVWSIKDQGPGKQGIWASPAIWKDMVYAATNAGRVLGIDRATGQIVWEKDLGSQTWGSPVVVDDVLIEGDCEGNLNAYDVSDTRVDPPLLWTVKLSGCIESTPAVWKGRIFVGARGGQFYAIGDPARPPAGADVSTPAADADG